ncbi:hypothetical protein CVT25_008489 [Psilocybe cyanescens]|uniref:Uncharacterized protein n=1 Tax=Psilocybe cyanescens TaxID=93625 RepID=A0A409XDF1_PSICY|nr:hypothetical protein CVT25_008489 [Psilocybe cyanescens]
MILSTVGAAREMRAWLPRRHWSLRGVCLWIPFATRCNGLVLLQLVRTGAAWAFSGSRMAVTNGMAPPPTLSAKGNTGALQTGSYPQRKTPEHELFVDELVGSGTRCSVPDVKESSGSSACLGGMNYTGIATHQDLNAKALANKDVQRQVLEQGGEISSFWMISHVDEQLAPRGAMCCVLWDLSTLAGERSGGKSSQLCWLLDGSSLADSFCIRTRSQACRA